MRIKNIFLIVMIAVVAISCEETVTDTELPYKEQLVVVGYLKDNKPFDSLLITKTLNPLEEATIEKAMVSNAEAEIIHNGESYPLNFTGRFYENKNIIPKSGETYILKVRWKGHNLSAEALVPYRPELVRMDTLIRESANKYNRKAVLYAYIKPGSAHSYNGYSLSYNINTYGIFKNSEINEEELVKAVIDIGYDYFGDNNFDLSEKYIIAGYSEGYYDYYKTRENGQSPEDIFSLSGQNIEWNVSGGLGLFVAVNDTIVQWK
ncbi:MAG: DUF4249 family protein [Candidatus Kapaibacterium sp.]